MPWTNQGGNGGSPGGGGRGPWGRGPGGGMTPPDLEEMLRRSQERLRGLLPGGGFGSSGLAVIALGVAIVWLASGIYIVNPDEQGVVLRFGQFIARTSPGINYHLPWPIEVAYTPKVTRENQINIGYHQNAALGDDAQTEDVPEESLMLTGDENIVDVNFTVFWVIKDASAYLFNVQEPSAAIKAVAESAMREVVGQNQIEPILTQDREPVQIKVRELMQATLDSYGAGVTITRVQMQKADPPAEVIDAYRDVQAARADQERARNEAEGYANKIIPEARGNASRIVQQAEAYRQQVIAEASGEAKHFLSVYEEYRKAPDITRKRMYLETISNLLGNMNKVIVDDNAKVLPYLPLPGLRNAEGNATVTTSEAPAPGGERPMSRTALFVTALAVVFALSVALSCVFTVKQTEEALVTQFGAPQEVVTDPGLHAKLPWQQVYFFDKRLLNLDAPAEEVIAQDKKRLVVDAFARWRIVDPLRFYQTLYDQNTALTRLTPILSSNVRRVLGSQYFSAVLSGKRAELMHDIRDNVNSDAANFGIKVVDVRIRRADLPPQNSEAIYGRMQQERKREANEFRAEGEETSQRIKARAEREVTVLTAEATRESEILRGQGDAEKTKTLADAYGADPDFFAFYRSMQAYQDALPGGNTTMVLSPSSEFFRYFSQPGGAPGRKK